MEEARLVTNTLVLEQLQPVSLDYSSDKLTNKLLKRLSNKQDFSLVLKFRGINLADTDIIGKSDPYLEVVDMNKKVLYRTETIRNNLNPKWKVFSLAQHQFAPNWNFHQLILKVFDRDLIGRNDLIGQVEITGRVLMAASKQKKSLTWRLYEKSIENGMQEVPVLRGKLKLDYALSNKEYPDLPELKVLEDELVFYNKHRGSLDNILAEVNLEELVTIEDVLMHEVEKNDDKSLPFVDEVMEEKAEDKNKALQKTKNLRKPGSSFGFQEVNDSLSSGTGGNWFTNIEKPPARETSLVNPENSNFELSKNENISVFNQQIINSEPTKGSQNFPSSVKNSANLSGHNVSVRSFRVTSTENSPDPITSSGTIISSNLVNLFSLEDSGLENSISDSTEKSSAFEGSAGLQNSSSLEESSGLETQSGESGDFENSAVSASSDDSAIEHPKVEIRPRERKPSQVCVDFNKVRSLSMGTQRGKLNFRSLDDDFRPEINRSFSVETPSQNCKDTQRSVSPGNLDKCNGRQNSLFAGVENTEIDSSQPAVFHKRREQECLDINEVEVSGLISKQNKTDKSSTNRVSNEKVKLTDLPRRRKSGATEQQTFTKNQFKRKIDPFLDSSDIFEQQMKPPKATSRETSTFEEYDGDEKVPRRELEFVCSSELDYLRELKNPKDNLTESFNAVHKSSSSIAEISKTNHLMHRDKLLTDFKKAELNGNFVHSKTEKTRSSGFSSTTKIVTGRMGKLNETTVIGKYKTETPVKSKSSFDLTKNTRDVIGQGDMPNQNQGKNEESKIAMRSKSKSSQDLAETEGDVIGQFELANQNEDFKKNMTTVTATKPNSQTFCSIDGKPGKESTSTNANIEVQTNELKSEKLMHISLIPNSENSESRRSSEKPEPATQKRSRSLTMYINEFKNETRDRQESDEFVRRIARSEEMTRRQSFSIQKRLPLKRQRSKTQKEIVVQKDKTKTCQFRESKKSTKFEQSLDPFGAKDSENYPKRENHHDLGQNMTEGSSSWQEPQIRSEESINDGNSSKVTDETEVKFGSQTWVRSSTFGKFEESTESAKNSDYVFSSITHSNLCDKLPRKSQTTCIKKEFDTSQDYLIVDSPNTQNDHRVLFRPETNNVSSLVPDNSTVDAKNPSSSVLESSTSEAEFSEEPQNREYSQNSSDSSAEPINLKVQSQRETGGAEDPRDPPQATGQCSKITEEERKTSEDRECVAETKNIISGSQSRKTSDIDQTEAMSTSENYSLATNPQFEKHDYHQCKNQHDANNTKITSNFKTTYEPEEKTEYRELELITNTERDATEASLKQLEAQNGAQNAETTSNPGNDATRSQSCEGVETEEPTMMAISERDGTKVSPKLPKTQNEAQKAKNTSNPVNEATRNQSCEAGEIEELEVTRSLGENALESSPVFRKSSDERTNYPQTQSQKSDDVIISSNVATGYQSDEKPEIDDEITATLKAEALETSQKLLENVDENQSHSQNPKNSSSAPQEVFPSNEFDSETPDFMAKLDANCLNHSSTKANGDEKQENCSLERASLIVPPITETTYHSKDDFDVRLQFGGFSEDLGRKDEKCCGPAFKGGLFSDATKGLKIKELEIALTTNAEDSIEVSGKFASKDSENHCMRRNLGHGIVSPVLTPQHSSNVHVQPTKFATLQTLSMSPEYQPVEAKLPENDTFFDSSSPVPQNQNSNDDDLVELVSTGDSSPSKKSEHGESCSEEAESSVEKATNKPTLGSNEAQLNELPPKNSNTKYWVAALAVGVLALGSAVYKMRYSE